MLDTKALAEATATIVREHVERAVAPLMAQNHDLQERIRALESLTPQQGEPGRDGRDGVDGRDADPEMIRALVSEAVALIPIPKDGADGEPGRHGRDGADGKDGAEGKDGAGIADLLIDREGALVATFTDGRIKSLGQVVGRDGRDGVDGRDGLNGTNGDDGVGLSDLAIDPAGDLVANFTDGRSRTLGRIVGRDGLDGTDGQDGAPGEKGEDGVGVEDLLIDRDGSLVAAFSDGRVKSVGVVVGRDGRDGTDGENGAPGEKGRDAVGIADLLIDREGTLVASFDDGRTKALGIVVGRAGRDGSDGRDGLPGDDGKDGLGLADLVIDRDGQLSATFTDGRKAVLGPVVGRDGVDGAPGRDGFGPEDIGVQLMDDGRTVRLAFDSGDTEYAFQIPFPVVIDRGVFSEGRTYEHGDAVSWGGSLWIAQRETAEKPDGPDSGWRLAVKRGRDGKDKV